MKIKRTALDNARNEIRGNIDLMGKEASRTLKEIIDLLNHLDPELASKIIQDDEKFNRLHETVHEECLTLIARHQPAASDLREVIADLQIAVEMERIADHMADIARIIHMCKLDSLPPVWEDIQEMLFHCDEMLTKMMTAFHDRDAAQAEEVAATDDRIDQMNEQIVKEIIQFMQSHGDAAANGTYLIWMVHNIERIGDRVTNIGEHILFAVSGKVADWNRSG